MNFLVRRLSRHRQEDGGYAMIMTLFLILIISIAMLAVMGVYLSQLTPTRLDKKRVQTVDAATAGLQAALGMLRNTTNSSGVGDLTKLPCTDTSDDAGIDVIVGSNDAVVALPGYQISGTVESTTNAGSTQTYRAVISYYSTDPTSHESDSITNTSNNWWTQNAITCKSGLVSTVPSYAYIQSFGANNAATGLATTEGDRTVHGIYTFSTENSNTTGGRLAEVNLSNPDSMCLDAGSNPVAGTIPEFEPCLAAGTAEQTWEYRSDLTIQYGGDTSLNLCIQNVTTVEGVAGTPKLETCETSGSGTTYPYANATQQEQEWAYNDSGLLQSPDVTDGGLGSGECLDGLGVTTSTTAYANDPLTMMPCSGGPDDYTAWDPDSAVGAGKSGGSSPNGLPSSSPTNQFVNYELFGNCLDVNGQNFANDLIAYPCKQAPDSSTLTWNQIWHFQVVSGSYGIFYTNCSAGAGGCIPSSPSSATADCLVSPTTENGLVTGAQCPTNGSYPTNELWKATGDQANDYPDSYQLISDSSGYCLSPDPASTSGGWEQIIVTNCDGADLTTSSGASISSSTGYLYLKWNAPANSQTPGLGDESEDNGYTTQQGNS